MFMKAVKELLVSRFGEVIDRLTNDQQKMVIDHMFKNKVEKVKRKQIHMLRLDLNNNGVAEEITTSETRWSRLLANVDEHGMTDDFIVVDFDTDQHGAGHNFFALSRGVVINEVVSTDPKREEAWLERTKGKVYKLFLQSASQQRTASAVFMADKGIGYTHQWENAIKTISYGWFPKEPMAVAKFLSATGLAQSSTQVANARVKFRVVADYEADNGFGPFKYTDGEGLISTEMMEMIAKTLMLNYVPGAVQVRIGGIKGLLIRWDDLDTDVVVTKKMVKMLPEGATELPLEICLVSKKVQDMNTFTYQFVNAISISTGDLKSLVDRHIAMMNGILTDPVKAMKYYGMIGEDESDEDGESPYEATLKSKVMRALDANPASLFDPWIQMKIRQSMERSLLDDAKGRIPVYGGYYFGASEPAVIMGEEPLLKKGQAYLNKRTGTVGVFRTPCIHRSEPCTLELVTSPELEEKYGHLKDVLILNVKDYTLVRLGGADCDGDKFFVTDEEVLVDAVENLPNDQIIWGGGSSNPTLVDITWERVIEHVYRKAKVSMIGHATDLGTTYSDKYRTAMTDMERLFYDNKVRLIRDIQGQLIDSAKMEYDVSVPPELETPERPHWLGRTGERIKTYHSTSPMGWLYDYIYTIYQGYMDVNKGQNMNLVVNLLEQVDPQSFYLIEGIVSNYIRGYNQDVQYVLDRFNLLDENGTTKDRRHLPKEIQDKLSEQLGNVAEKYQGLMDTLTALVDPETIAITAYLLSYQRASNGKGYSFPWTACADGLISAMSRVAQGRFMLTPVKSYKGYDIPEKVDVTGGLLFAEEKFVGVSTLKDGTYEVISHNDNWYAKVPRVNTLSTVTQPCNKYQFTLVGVTPEVIQYLTSQVGNTIVLNKYNEETPEGIEVMAYGLFYNGYKIGKVANSSVLAGASIVDREVKLLSAMPSKTGKSVDLYVEVL